MPEQDLHRPVASAVSCWSRSHRRARFNPAKSDVAARLAWRVPVEIHHRGGGPSHRTHRNCSTGQLLRLSPPHTSPDFYGHLAPGTIVGCT
jgi:hypothetical protein